MSLGGPSCPRPNLSPSRSPARPIYKVRRAKYRSGSEGRKSGAHAKYGRFPCAPIGAAYQPAFQGPKWALILRDVKNEGRTGYMHENTGDDDKMSSEKHGFYTKNAPIAR